VVACGARRLNVEGNETRDGTLAGFLTKIIQPSVGAGNTLPTLTSWFTQSERLNIEAALRSDSAIERADAASRFGFVNLRPPAGSRMATALAAHHLRTGCAPWRSFLG
jgi:hypothetical protein